MRGIRKEINRVLSLLLLNCFLSFNIFAAGIEVDKNVPQNVHVDHAPNGVPLINISTPTNKGTSINSFKEFNVDNRGVEILNNTGVGRGHLSGIVNPNPNLLPGQEARTVVFKVTGTNRSEIEGYISALSPKPIHLFIANEKGIYVNGGGFINIERSVLTTGKVNIQDGDVVSFTARDGSVIIGEKGLDISSVERVDIISRTQELAGKIVGKKDVNIVLGQNEVSLSGIVTPIVTSDNKPALSLNGGALGSIYSNGQVNIISTEKGVGVNLKSDVISEEELRIKINGNGEIKGAVSKKVNIESENLHTETINGNSININVKDFENKNTILGQNVNIISNNFKNNELKAENLNIKSENIESNKIEGNKIRIKGNTLKTNKIEADNVDLNLSDSLNNKGNITANTSVITAKSINSKEITSGTVKINTRNIQSNKILSNDLNIKADNLKTGTIESKKADLNVNGSIHNTDSITANDLNINTKSLNSNIITTGKGIINSKDTVSKKIEGNEIRIKGNTLKTDKIEGKNIDLNLNDSLNNKGNILADTLNITSKDIESKSITAIKGNIKGKDIRSDEIISNDLNVTADQFITNDKIDATSINFNLQKDFHTKGTISTDNLKITSNNIINDGKVLSGNAYIKVRENIINNDTINIGTADISGKRTENKGSIKANKLIVTTSENIVNTGTLATNNGTLNAHNLINTNRIETENLTVKTLNNIENTGHILSNNLTLNTGTFINRNELTVDKGTLTVDNEIINENKINANELNTTSSRLENKKKIEVGKGSFTVREEIENKDVIIGNNISFKGKELINSPNSTIFTTDKIEADMTQKIINNRAEILSQGEIDLKAPLIQNHVGKIKGTGDVKLTGNTVENIGKTGDLTKYKLYWETWDGQRYDSPKVWPIRPREALPGSTEDKEATFEYYLNEFGGTGKVSYIFNVLKDTVRQKKYTESGSIGVASAEYPVIPLINKIESKAKTEHALITGKNVTISLTGELNNTDGIISSNEINKINAPKIIHKVTIDENNPIHLTDGAEILEWWKSKHRGKNRYPVNYRRFLVPSSRVGYVSGQPSIIEGKEVHIDKTKIVTERFDTGKGQIKENVGNRNDVNTKQIEVVKNVSGIGNIKNTGIISINIGDVFPKTGIANRNGISISNLYIPSTNPSSKYILENRTEFITMGNYYGGEYFLTRMGYVEDWDRVKLLGDAYYDNILIEQTLTEKLGTRFINGISGKALTKELIDNAITAKKDLDLRQGISLTKDQINKLKNDIIWYEYEEVEGKKVLVPKIYLSKASIEKLEVDGRSKIYGTDKTIVEVDGELKNEGLKIGSITGITEVRGDRIRNESITNEISEIVGKRVKVEAIEGNIENVGGKITAKEKVELAAVKGDILNDSKKVKEGYYLNSTNNTEYERVSNIGEISGESVSLKTNNYNSTGGALLTKELELELKGDINAKGLELRGKDRFGDNKNYQKYGSKEYVGSGIVTEKVLGKVNDINLRGSAFIAEDGKGLSVRNVNVESLVNEYDIEKKTSSKGVLSKSSSFSQSHIEENVEGNFKIGKEGHISGTLSSIGSNIYLGENSYIGGKVRTDSRELHNSYYEENKKSGFSGSIGKGSISVGYGKNRNTYDEKSVVNAKSRLHIGDKSVLNNGAEITATDFEHGQIEMNNGDVIFGARKDRRDVSTTSKSSNIGISVGIKSPIVDRVRQAGEALEQIKSGDTIGGAVNGVNFVTGTVSGLAGNQGNRQTRYTEKGIKNSFANNNFYANIGINASFNKTKNETKSHTEGATVTTIRGLDESSSITYNNVKNITYKGTEAEDTKFIYNNVENINKESVELNNSYSSESKGFGINAGATIGYGHKLQTTGNGGSISVNKNNLNTTETIHHNGSFKNVDEVHNNTKNMRLKGFNQEGGTVTGNIENLELISVQNTSGTTGSSSGINIGVSSNGIPNSIGISGSKTNGNRAFVDNQTTFIVGNGSNLTIGKTENTGAIIGKEGNSRVRIDEYIGKDIQNYDTTKTTGGSIGLQTGKTPISNIGLNQDSRDKAGITRNTVLGDIEIGKEKGSPINRDITKANEVTKDTQKRTDINIESQTIEYATNPTRFKEDLGKAKQEIEDIGKAIVNSIKEKGGDNRNFIELLNSQRRGTAMNNLLGADISRLNNLYKNGDISTEDYQKGIEKLIETFGKDIGLNIDLVFADTKNMPKDSKNNEGAAYVDKRNKVTTIPINVDNISSTSQLIGTVFEEVSHVFDGVAGKQKENDVTRERGEKGLESLGRPINDYFTKQYEKEDEEISLIDQGINLTNADLGNKVGDVAIVDDATIVTVVLIVGTGYVVYQGAKVVATYVTSEEAQRHAQMVAGAIGGTFDRAIRSGQSAIDWLVEQGGKVFSKGSTKNERKSNDKAVEKAKEDYERAKKEYEDLKSKPNKTPEDKEARKTAEKKMKDALDKMRKSEDHSRRGKGQQGKGGGNKR